MIIAIDTGGTKTLIARFDTDGIMTQLARFATPRDPAQYLDAVTEAIRTAPEADSIDAISIALPGPIIDGQLLRAKNINESWQAIDIIALLKDRFSEVPLITVANDADLAGISEARALSPVPAVSLYVTLSTGVGTGLAFEGHLPHDLQHFEGGWMRLPYDDKLQMWEAFASGKNFYERYQQYGADVDDPEKWQDYAKRAAAGFVALIPMFAPDRVIIGGSMGTHFAKYGEFLQAEVADALPQFDTSLIVQAKHPEEAVIYGCYYHAIDQLAD